MLASHRWLVELCGFERAPDEVAARLTSAGIEVEGVRSVGGGFEHVVVAEVKESRPHPSRERLKLVRVDDGAGGREVVCGAPNVPAPGGRVVLACPGAALANGMVITERELGGIVSSGMLASEVELGVGSDADGILVLSDADTTAAPGTPLTEALDLADAIYDLSLTPNRPDALGHVGLARELCVLFEAPFRLPTPEPVPCTAAPAALFPQGEARIALPLGQVRGEASGFSPVRVDLVDPVRCPRYGAALVSDLDARPSPFALRYRLHLLGQRAKSGIVDATNLVLLGFGHPIHAFDYDRLRGSRIEVRRARAGERMRTLDGADHTLTDDDLLICDGAGPVALAGVMGGEGSEIGPETRRVLIECAYFDPRTVRRTSKRTGVRTESSHRFERGVDPAAVPAVLAHAASLVARLGGGVVVTEGLDVGAAPPAPPPVRLRRARLDRLLGTSIEADTVERVLAGHGCGVRKTAGDWEVVLPSHRPDLAREIDLVEEIARTRGYESLPTELASIRPSQGGTPRSIAFVRDAREAAAAAGLDEAVCYAFVSPADLRAARVPTAAVRIANPLSEERSVLRTSLLPGLVASLRRAQSHRLDRFAQFELGRVFEPDPGAPLPRERRVLGVLLWGARRLWYARRETFDFYDGKGVVTAIVASLGGGTVRTAADPALDTAAPYLHPKRRARIDVGGTLVGHLGELHPDVVTALELEGRPVFAALDVASVEQAVTERGLPRASALPRFPAVTRDIAVVVPEAHEAGAVAPVLAEVGAPLVEEVTLFDIYRGVPVPDGHKSLAFRVVYRDAEATLTDERVDELHARLLRVAEERFGAEVRR